MSKTTTQWGSLVIPRLTLHNFDIASLYTKFEDSIASDVPEIRLRPQNLQEAQLSHSDRATTYISLNLVNSCTVVRKISFERACRRWVALKVTRAATQQARGRYLAHVFKILLHLQRTWPSVTSRTASVYGRTVEIASLQAFTNKSQLIRATFPEVWELKRFQTTKVTFKVTQDHSYWCHSIGLIRFPVSLSFCKYVSVLHRFRYITCYFP